jgi:hypothetical protein
MNVIRSFLNKTWAHGSPVNTCLGRVGQCYAQAIGVSLIGSVGSVACQIRNRIVAAMVHGVIRAIGVRHSCNLGSFLVEDQARESQVKAHSRRPGNYWSYDLNARKLD